MKTSKKNLPIVISDEHNEIKIYTTAGRAGVFYQLSYYRAGVRQRKTFADMNEAKREARMILGRLSGERIQSHNLSAVEMESYTIAMRTIEQTGVPLHVCAELFAEARRILGGHSITDAAKYYMRHYDPKRPRKPLSDLATEFTESRRAIGVSSRYVSTVDFTMRSLVTAFKNTSLDDLESSALDQWMEGRKITNRSKNTYRVILVCFGNFLRKRKYLPADRPTVFHGMCVWKDEISPVTVFTVKEMRKLLTNSTEHLMPYFALGAFAGLRSAEITRLDWKNILFKRGFIECEASMTKTRQRRLVPISDNLRAWLEPIAPPSGKVILHAHMGDAAMTLAKKFGVQWKKNALRHSYISNRLAMVPDTARVALECGNSPNVIFKHYRELVTPEDAKKWFNIFPGADYPKCLLTRRKKFSRKPKWDSHIQLTPQVEAGSQPQPLRLLPAPDAVAPEIVGDTGLNDEEIRRALLG